MQLATPVVDPEPSGPNSALHIDTFELNATPATPMPLFALPVIVPETWVPWSLSSTHVLDSDTVPPPTRPRTPCEAPAQFASLPARSGCVLSIPVSTMPTVVPPDAGKAARPARSQPSG